MLSVDILLVNFKRAMAKSPWLGFILLAFLLLLVYLPTFTYRFAYHSDALVWDYENSKCCLGFPESYHLLEAGRPLGALLLNIQFMFLNSFDDFTISRLVSFWLILFSAGIFYYYLILRVQLETHWALVMVFCIFTLPPSQTYEIVGTHLVPGALNILLAMISYI